MVLPDGTIEFESPHVLIPITMTRDDFLESALAVISRPLNQNAPYSRYEFKPVIIRGEQFAGDICFCSGRLYWMFLESMRPEFGSFWNEYSADKEEAKHEFHKKFLREVFKLSDSLVFSWGTVSAVIDDKSAVPFISIKYRDTD